METEVVLYHDATYSSCWINKKKGFPKKIANYFLGKGIKLLNADELKDFMISAIENNLAHQKLVVFSQDAIPRTLVENVYSTTTFREYLDSGGSVLWIGDIPLYYIGEKEKDATLVDVQGTPTNMIGIVPVYAWHPKTTVEITPLGKRIGLKHKWSGTRPILKDKGIRKLAQSETILCRYYIDVKKKKNLLSRFWDWLRTIKTFKAANFELGFGTDEEKKTKKTDKKPQIYVHENHVNAWVKCFNDAFPNTGFYRIWDYEPRNLTDNNIEELYQIAEAISDKIPKTNYLRTAITQIKNLLKDLFSRLIHH